MARASAKTKKTPPIGRPTMRVIVVDSDPDVAAWERMYLGDLHRLIDRIFERAAVEHEWSWWRLASNSNLGYQTVCNLGFRRTKYPRFSTVYKLAQAVGWNLQMTGGKQKAERIFRFVAG